MTGRQALGLGAYALAATAAAVYFAFFRTPAERMVVRVVEREVPAPAPEREPALAESLARRAEDASLSLFDRTAALQEFPLEISEAEAARLWEVAASAANPASVRNDAMTAMARTGHPFPGALERLAAMWRDEEEDYEWRAYCLQHLEIAYRLDEGGQALAEDVLLAAVAHPDPYFAGTAMLSVARLGETNPDLLDAARALSQGILDRAGGAGEGALPVATALQVARQTRNPASLRQARRLASDEEVPVMVRLSALGVLGELGLRQDLPLVERLASDDEPEARVRRVARHSATQLKARLDDPAAP